MLAPTVGAVGLLAVGAGSVSSVLAIEHVAMIVVMLAVMVWRREEYTRCV